MSRPNHWRMSAETTRLWFFDAVAGVPLIFMLFHLRMWTFILAIFVFFLLAFLERKGYSLKVGLRRLRSWAAGRVRVGQPWWSDKQERQ
jgi:hypothetical protein